jgi:hypothetical protein
MQIKSIITAAVAVTCLFSMSPAIAAYGEQFIFQETIPETDNAKNAEEPKTKPEELAMKKIAQTTVAVRVRVGQSRGNHRDARACLNKASNPAIIKCAEKYRYL